MNWKPLSGLAITASLAAFPWGPLFAWSPVHPGYQLDSFSRADVLHPESTPLDEAYKGIDSYLAAAEDFHELKFSTRVKVVVCGTWNDCLRFAAPFLLGQRPLAVTAPTGTVIFVTPRANGWADVGALLRHELSHAVQNQNRSLLSVVRMLREPWVSEGVAGVVAAKGTITPGRHLPSLPDADFLSRAQTEDLWPSFTPQTKKDWAFSYTAWIYLWNRQIDRFGKPTFLQFERECFSAPQTCRSAFATTWGTDLQQTVTQLQQEIRSGQIGAPKAAF